MNCKLGASVAPASATEELLNSKQNFTASTSEPKNDWDAMPAYVFTAEPAKAAPFRFERGT